MSDFISSDHCLDCGGIGYRSFKTLDTGEYHEIETEQCEECERLHGLEIKADIYSDLER